jgi:hypothetical protein
MSFRLVCHDEHSVPYYTTLLWGSWGENPGFAEHTKSFTLLRFRELDANEQFLIQVQKWVLHEGVEAKMRLIKSIERSLTQQYNLE